MNVAVIGVGNLLMKDDGMGIHAVQRLQGMELPPGVEIFDCDTRAFLVLEAMDGKDGAMIIDAFESGKDPGTITVMDLRAEDFQSAPSLSMHDFTFSDALRSAGDAFDLPEKITIIGVEPKEVGMDDQLSPELEKALKDVMRRVLEMLDGKT